MNNKNIENKSSPTLLNKISTQQHLNHPSPLSPFKVINSNEQSSFTVEQTNCRLNEPLSPFARENNTNKFARKPIDTSGKNNHLKILTQQKSPVTENKVPISPFNLGSPGRNNFSGSKSQPLTSKGNQVFSAQADMPIIPQADSYNQGNHSSWVTTTSAVTSASPAFYDIKRELNMSNINSMVTNVRKGQESNIIDKILFDTPYSGLVDQKYDKELVRHNSKNNTLYKCFSRSSSGIFSFRPADTAPNINTVYYIDTGSEIGTSSLHVNKDAFNNKKLTENVYQSNKGSNTNISITNNEKENTLSSPMKSLSSSVKSLNTPNSNKPNTPISHEVNQSPQNNNNKLTSTFSYDPEYLLWRDALINILKNNITEADSYGNNSIGAYYKNINNENQTDYSLRMPIELLTLLNTKIK